MIDLLAKLAEKGITLSQSEGELKVRAPQGALSENLRHELKSRRAELIDYLIKAECGAKPLPVFAVDEAANYEPFPLSDLQHSYWLGRDTLMRLGGVATHLYLELESEGLSIEGLQRALNKLISSHDMLRAIVERSGKQRILESVPKYELRVNGSDEDEALASAAANTTRSKLSHEVRDADQWPLFGVEITQFPNQRQRLHISLDLLILDALSIHSFFEQWYQIYTNPEMPVKKPAVKFRDYRMFEVALLESGFYSDAQKYWLDRLDSIPAPPDLPLNTDSIIASERLPFQRKEFKMPAQRWRTLSARSREHGLTPSSLLIAAYSEVLARWSRAAHFTLNVTVSNRLPVHEDINAVIGDFINLVMLEVDRRDAAKSFVEFAFDTHVQLTQDLEHAGYSGVAVMRDWAKHHQRAGVEIMPVVFSSGLVLGDGNEVGNLEQFGRKVHSISQTPQVWIDQHVVEVDGGLVLVWDVPGELCVDSTIDRMFADYANLVDSLCDDESQWHDKVPSPEQYPVTVYDETLALDGRALHANFVSRCMLDSSKTAIFSCHCEISYGQLLNSALIIAKQLKQLPSDPAPIAIVMHRGWEQVAAVLGVLLADHFYLPIDADLPEARIQTLLKQANPLAVIAQSNSLLELSTPANLRR